MYETCIHFYSLRTACGDENPEKQMEFLLFIARNSYGGKYDDI